MFEPAFQKATQSILHSNADFSPLGGELVRQLDAMEDDLFTQVLYESQKSDAERKPTHPHPRAQQVTNHQLLLAEISIDTGFIVSQTDEGLVTSQGFVAKEMGARAVNNTVFYMGREVVLSEDGGLDGGLAYSREEFIVIVNESCTEIAHGEFHANHPGLHNPLLPVQISALPESEIEALEAMQESLCDLGFPELPDPHTRLLMCMNAIDDML